MKRLRNGASALRSPKKEPVSVYGLGRFPVTLYQEQWEKLLNEAENIRTFVAENKARLKAKESAD